MPLWVPAGMADHDEAGYQQAAPGDGSMSLNVKKKTCIYYTIITFQVRRASVCADVTEDNVL